MENLNLSKGVTRRGFISGLAPACVLTCLGGGKLTARNLAHGNPAPRTSGHKFDRPYNRELTLRQFSDMRHRSLISFAKTLEREIGRQKMLAYLKMDTMTRMRKQGEAFARRAADNSFDAFTGLINNPGMLATLEMKIIEDTDIVFEIIVTECLTADTFLRADAGEIGNAAVCIGDYTFAEGFNPYIRMKRTKTLTLGHNCCNHRYEWID